MEPNDHKIRFSYTLTYMQGRDHLVEWVKKYCRILPWKVFVVFGALSGTLQTFSFFWGSSWLSNPLYFVLVLCLSVAFGLIFCVYDYFTYTPEGLEACGSEAQKIARWKKPFWEYSLACQLFRDEVSALNQKIYELESNRTYVKLDRHLSLEEYIRWSSLRSKNLERLVDIITQTFMLDLIPAIHSVNDDDLNYSLLLKMVKKFRQLYEESYLYLREGKEVLAPDGCQIIHEIQDGWAVVVTNIYNQIVENLESISTRNSSDMSSPKFSIIAKEVPNLDLFCSELEKISSKKP